LPKSPPPLVLILENDPASAAALELLVRDGGYETLLATRLSELPAVAEKARACVALIVDYHLHDGTGVEAVRQLAALGITPPVLMMTGTLRGKARTDATAAGHRFLEKPVDPAAIMRWLNDSAARA
jgi:FOG: CheY-like receiver